MDGQATTEFAPKLFRVRSSTPSTDLGSAIAHAVMEEPEIVMLPVVLMRAVGAGAINQAIKAIPVAKGFVVGFGVHIVFDANFFHGKAVEGEILGLEISVMRR